MKDISRQRPDNQGFSTIAQNSIPIGVNYPWGKYGWDFGEPLPNKPGSKAYPASWGRCPWKKAEDGRLIRDVLIDFKNNLKIRVVRWFILGDGMYYGTGPEAPKWNGDKKYWECAPPDSDKMKEVADEIKKDFEKLLKEFAGAGIQILPSLIDFHWLQTGKPPFDKNGDPIPGYIKGGRYDIIVNKDKRKAFLNIVFKNLLEVSKIYKDVIFAWEVINEPEWYMQGHSSPSTWKLDRKSEEAQKMIEGFKKLNIDYDKTTTVWPKEIPARQTPDNDMAEFVKEAVKMIKSEEYNDCNFTITVGSKTASDFRWLKFWQKCGIDLFQFHDYEDKWGKATVALDKEKLDKAKLSPCIIGEFPTKWIEDPTKWGKRLKRLFSNDAEITKSYFRDAKKNGWTLIMPWSVFQKDDATNWAAAKNAINKLIKEKIIYSGAKWP